MQLIILRTFQRYKFIVVFNLSSSISQILKLGDEIQEFYKKTFGKVATASMLTHLRRELAQAVLGLLLDDNLICAYTDGVPIKLFDGTVRALYPRFLCYCADYPEK